MTVFGNKNFFAFEIELDPKFHCWPYGKFCIWISGNIFGNYDEGCHLGALVELLNEVKDNEGKSIELILPQLDNEDFYYFCKYWLHDKFDKEGNLVEISNNPPKTNILLVNPLIDIMRNIYIFKKEQSDLNYKLIFNIDNQIKEVIVSKIIYKNLIDELIEHLIYLKKNF